MVSSTALEPMTIELSELFGALADPVRVRIVALLATGERCVCDLLRDVDVAPNLLSYHLRVLRHAGLIRGTRRGRWIDYAIDHEGFDAFWEQVGLAGVPLAGEKRSMTTASIRSQGDTPCRA